MAAANRVQQPLEVHPVGGDADGLDLKGVGFAARRVKGALQPLVGLLELLARRLPAGAGEGWCKMP